MADEAARPFWWGRIKLVVGMVCGWVLLIAFLIVVGDLLGIAWNRLWNGEWRFYSLNQALAYVGLRPIHFRREIPLSVVVVVASMVAFGIIGEFTPKARARRAEERKAQRELNIKMHEAKRNRPLEKRMPYRIGKRIRALIVGWFWPRARRTETSAAIRAGRVLHWTFLVFAAPLAAIVAYGLLYFVFTGETGSDGVSILAFLAALSLALAIVGRAFRYVLANE